MLITIKHVANDSLSSSRTAHWHVMLAAPSHSAYSQLHFFKLWPLNNTAVNPTDYKVPIKDDTVAEN